MKENELNNFSELMTKFFFDSEELASKIAVELENYHPITMMFAALVIDEIKSKRDPRWDGFRKLAIESFKDMKKEGLITDKWME